LLSFFAFLFYVLLFVFIARFSSFPSLLPAIGKNLKLKRVFLFRFEMFFSYRETQRIKKTEIPKKKRIKLAQVKKRYEGVGL